MMFLALWGKVTGKDKRQQMPTQQAVALGRTGDYVIVFPYGMYADLPTDAMLKEIAEGVMVPVTVDRPSDTEQGEPVFFHPKTNTRIIARKNGDLDVISSTKVKVTAPEVEVLAATSVSITSPLTTVTGDLAVVTATTKATVTSPSIEIGNGTIDLVALMAEICDTREIWAGLNGHAAEQPAWAALATKIRLLT